MRIKNIKTLEIEELEDCTWVLDGLIVKGMKLL